MRACRSVIAVGGCLFWLLSLFFRADGLAACSPPVRIAGDEMTSPTSVQNAYDVASQASPSFSLLLAGEIFTEDLFLDGGTVLFEGGYDCTFADRSAVSGLYGTLTIAGGAASFAGRVAIVSTDRCDFDADLDGYLRYTGIGACVGSDGDCQDQDASISPGEAELCDGLDNNCDGQVDEGVLTDADGDGYYEQASCPGSPYADDCDDADAAIHPGALDLAADSIDQDCSGSDLIYPEGEQGGACHFCHGPGSGYAELHAPTSAPELSCGDCHDPFVGNILPAHYGRTVLTVGNGMNAGGTIGCKSCHDQVDIFHKFGSNTLWPKVKLAQPNVTCDTCHQDRIIDHSPGAAHDNRIITPGCGDCHTGGSGALANDADVEALHRSDCALCHNYNGNTVNAAIVRMAIRQGASGDQVNCNGCHNKGVDHHGGGSSGGGCVECHGHDAGTLFDPDSSVPYIAGIVASQGAGTFQSHSTHTELDSDDARGPGLYCDSCHDINNFPYFKSGSDADGDGRFDLAKTDVCDPCHSPGGAFDGVNASGYGAKAGWQGGIYLPDGSLQTGREFWCISCHDGVPGNSRQDGSGVLAPDKAGDNSSYGYYATGHGVTTGYNATLHGQNGPGYQCTVCHDSRLPHFSHSLGDANRFAGVPDDGLDYTSKVSEICLDCHLVGQTGIGALGFDAATEASIHSGAVSGNFNTPAATAFPAYGDSADYATNPGYQCEACHEVHGTTKLAMVLETIDGQVGGTSTPVAITGFGVTDTDLRDLDPTSLADDGVCDACHATGNLAHPDTNHPGNHNQGNAGSACIDCHKHNTGFTAACDVCHEYPPPTNAHLLHNQTLGYGCGDCHFGNNHNPGNISSTPVNFLADYDRNEVDVAFDPTGFNSDANNGTVLGAAVHTYNAASALATCNNLTCHNPDNALTGKGIDSSTNNIPVWGDSISDCTDCHALGGDAWDGGDHMAHDNPSYMDNPVPCTGCHALVDVVDPIANGTDSRHANKSLDINQMTDYPVKVDAQLPYNPTITANYSDGVADTTTGSRCSSVYCHGDVELASDTALNTTFIWGTTTFTDTCNDCHRHYWRWGSSTNRSHNVHLDTDYMGQTYLYGPKLGEATCESCHPINSPTHLNGRGDFNDTPFLATTSVCDPCHGTAAGIAEAKANWELNTTSNTQRISDCLLCHNGTAPASSSVYPAVAIVAPDKEASTLTGHGRTGLYNATGNTGPGYGCESCHDPDTAHISHTLGDQARLRSVTGDSLAYTDATSEFCLDCHQVGQNSNGDLGHDASSEVSVHSGGVTGSYNTGSAAAFPAYGDSANYAANPGYQCEACHEVHGTTKLAMVLETIDGQVGGTSNPVAIIGFEASDVDLRDLDPSIAADNGVCDVCHALGSDPHPDTSHPGNHHQGNTGSACIQCHSHSASFAHGGGAGGDCSECHGKDADNGGAGTTLSHSTHTETDADDARGPGIACVDCHDTNNYPFFKSGVDSNGNGKYNLAETDVCAPCHSPGGPYDGINDPVIGAKNNWSNGVYNGTELAAGKERWCVGCHDSGSSIISGRQAPDIAGNDSTWGYYVSGHGGVAQECGACHGASMDHSLDGTRTYLAASDNYRQGFRLKDVGGTDPMNIPNPASGCGYLSDDFKLCWQCHDEAALLNNPLKEGFLDCVNPFNGPFGTGFRNESLAGYYWGASDVPANIHWDHLEDINRSFGPDWNSDGSGTEVRTSCPACHNVHGDELGDGTATLKMTRGEYRLNFGTDANGDYGQVGPDNSWTQCSALCHGQTSGYKYYRSAP